VTDGLLLLATYPWQGIDHLGRNGGLCWRDVFEHLFSSGLQTVGEIKNLNMVLIWCI
jgi:hypothetical protein